MILGERRGLLERIRRAQIQGIGRPQGTEIDFEDLR